MGGHVSTLEEELTEVELEHLKVSVNTKNCIKTLELYCECYLSLINVCLKAETGFETRQVRRLFMRFKHLDRSNKGYLEKSDLLVLKEVS